MSTWILVVFAYYGTWHITSIPGFAARADCELAGRQVELFGQEHSGWRTDKPLTMCVEQPLKH